MIIPTEKIIEIDGETYIKVNINKKMLHYLYQFIGKHRTSGMDVAEKRDIGMMMRGVHQMKKVFNKKDGIVTAKKEFKSNRPDTVRQVTESDIESNKPTNVKGSTF